MMDNDSPIYCICGTCARCAELDKMNDAELRAAMDAGRERYEHKAGFHQHSKNIQELGHCRVCREVFFEDGSMR